MSIHQLLSLDRRVLEGLCQKQAHYSYLGSGVGLCRVLGRYLIYVDPLDTSVAPHLIMRGHWEIWITQALCRVRAGRVKVAADVGANVGYYSLVMSDLFEGCEVHAFEPQQDLATLLKRSADVNGFRYTLEVHQQAVGVSSDGPVRVKLPEGELHNRGSGWCVPALSNSGEVLGGIPQVSLDDAVEKPLDFIKIDAEGFEEKVWRGMSRHLENRPIVLMEFTPGSYSDAKGFLQEIASCYPLREVDSGGSVVPVEASEVLETEGFRMLWLETEEK
jgi:FkbM family methyltransferase